MRSLSQYIIENQQVSLEECIINEGLLNWLKKAWNWLKNSTQKNTSKNGRYVTDDETLEKIKSNTELKSTFEFPQLDEKTFYEIIDNTKSKDKKKGSFYFAYEHYKNNKGLIIYNITTKKQPSFGFIFSKKLKDDQLKIDKIILNQDIIQSTENIEENVNIKKMINDLNKWVKDKYNNKYDIKGPVKTDVIDTEVNDDYEMKETNKDKKDETTN